MRPLKLLTPGRGQKTPVNDLESQIDNFAMEKLIKRLILFFLPFFFGICTGGEIAAEAIDAERLFVLADIVRLRSIAVVENRVPPDTALEKQWILAECANLRKDIEIRHFFRRLHASFLNFIIWVRKLFARRDLAGIVVGKADPYWLHVSLARLEKQLSESANSKAIVSTIDNEYATREEVQKHVIVKGIVEW